MHCDKGGTVILRDSGEVVEELVVVEVRVVCRKSAAVSLGAWGRNEDGSWIESISQGSILAVADGTESNEGLSSSRCGSPVGRRC